MVLSARTKHALGRSRHSANISAHILSRLILSSGLSWRLQSLMGFLTRPFEEFDLDCRICSSGENASTALSCPFLSPVPISYLTLHLQSAPTICYNLPVPVTQENIQEIFFVPCSLPWRPAVTLPWHRAQSSCPAPSSARQPNTMKPLGCCFFCHFTPISTFKKHLQ